MTRSGTNPPREPLGPVRAGRDVVRPEHQRHTGALDDAAEQRLRPGGMADDAIESSRGIEDRGQRRAWR